MRFIANLLVDRNGTADALAAAAVAGTLSGLPSVTLAFTRRQLMPYAEEAMAASAAIVGVDSWPRLPRFAAGAAVHGLVSLWWCAVLAAVLPRRRPLLAGAAAGLVIAVFDLGVVGRRIPAVRRLAPGPQILDHLAFGVSAAAVITHRRRCRAGGALPADRHWRGAGGITLRPA